MSAHGGACAVAAGLFAGLCALACSGAEPGKPRSGLDIDSGTLPDGGQFVFDGGAGGAGGGSGVYVFPAGFTHTEYGGYKLGDAFNSDTPPTGSAGSSSTSNGCGTTIAAVIRDFKGKNEVGGHPDFEAFMGPREVPGLVGATLGSDQKPTYTGICELNRPPDSTFCGDTNAMTTSKAAFDQWYRFADTVNKPFVIYFSLQPNPSSGVITFQSDMFFPLDGMGWGNNGAGDDGIQHNFAFTTEIHTEVKYSGGETFTFIGDDDVWVFINKKLVVDLGGVHPQVTGSVSLDDKAAELGIEKGKTYPVDLFQAERHTTASHFRIDTNLAFTNCGIFVPDIPK